MNEVVKSPLKFSNPRITALEFEIHNHDSIGQTADVTINMEVSTKRVTNHSAKVSMVICVGDKEKSGPFWIRCVVEAEFDWGQSFDEDTIQLLLNQNCPLLLLSYARSFISHLTVDAGYPPLFIPFIDLTQHKDDPEVQKQ